MTLFNVSDLKEATANEKLLRFTIRLQFTPLMCLVEQAESAFLFNIFSSYLLLIELEDF